MNAVELAETVLGDEPLPANVRKVMQTALAEGWELHSKGASFCMRFDHADDNDAVPFYVTWQVVPQDSGKVSWRFMSAGTATLQPMNFKDVMSYLTDPTVIWPLDPEADGAE